LQKLQTKSILKDTMNTMHTMNTNATYCPEDNNLRLYVGRVPRDEYLKLRSEGWVSTPKQDCDFVATWTPQRRDTALFYGGGVIEDEDMGPDERAADRAERFSGYRDSRMEESTGHADAYAAGPSAHGYQSPQRAERAAARHDRQAGKALDAWDKAEYWQRRTAGVITHALYVCSPSVRMGRIKTLEAEQRKLLASREEARRYRDMWVKVADMTDPDAQRKAAIRAANVGGLYDCGFRHPRPESLPEGHYYRRPDASTTSLYSLLTCEAGPITGAEAAAMYLAAHGEVDMDSDWTRHHELRLAYENQMLQAQGGRAASVEMEVGGWLGPHQIHKVNKSPATGRVVSVLVRSKLPEGMTQWKFHQIETERLSPDAYRPATPEELAAFKAMLASEKAAKPKTTTIPFPNLTQEDAKRLAEVWGCSGENYRRARWGQKPIVVVTMTQAEYSERSKGTYGQAGTEEITGGGQLQTFRRHRDDPTWPVVAKVRTFNGCPVVLSDKPGKALPASVWEDPRPAARAAVLARLPELAAACALSWHGDMTPEQLALFNEARRCGLARFDSLTQFGLKGEAKELDASSRRTVTA
jgi:hypothetical protein